MCTKDVMELTDALVDGRLAEFVEASAADVRTATLALAGVADDVAAAAMRTLLLLVCVERVVRQVALGADPAASAAAAADALVLDHSAGRADRLRPNFAGESYGYVVAHTDADGIHEVCAALREAFAAQARREA